MIFNSESDWQEYRDDLDGRRETMTKDFPSCPKCGIEMTWVECDQCEEGYSGHDCGEDTCCCAEPEENVVCDICNGRGGWYACLECADPEWVSYLIQDGRI